MSFKNSLAKALVLLLMEVGALCGVPITLKQIEELMRTLTRSHHEQVLESDDGEEKDRKPA